MIQEATKAFLKAFPTKMKPTKCPAKEKNEARKAKKEVGEKARSKSKTALSLLTPPPPPRSPPKILLSAHARTSQANTFYIR